MEFYHLRSFVVVAETGNLTKAAKQLYTTPPAISSHIKALEEELKTALFDRSSKGMALTEKGQLLLVQARKTLDSAQDMVNLAVETSEQVIGTFRLGLNREPSALHISKLATGLQQHCPGIKLELVSLSSGDIVEQLLSEQLDGGFVYGDLPEALYSCELIQQAITTIAPLSFDLSKIAIEQELSTLPWISVGKHCPFDQAFIKRFNLAHKPTFASAENQSRVALVESGLGLSFIETEVAQALVNQHKAQRLTMLDFALPLKFTVKTSLFNNPVVKAVLLEVCDVWQVNLPPNK